MELKKNDTQKMIYEIRGKQVMLDSDLARLYECKNGTKDINKAVNRNIGRFPGDFYFQLSAEEYAYLLRFHSGTLKTGRGGHRKYLPYVFTEQGVSMLASVLRSEVSEKVSVEIMRAFVAMRKYIGGNLLEQKYINNQVMKNTEDIKLLQDSFAKFEEKKKTNEIYFNGQIYDAYSKICEIFSEAKKKLIVVDNYADRFLLDMIKNLNVDAFIVTKKDNLLSRQDIYKYNKQYNNLKVVYNDTFHDRYFILDNNKVYHCGASVNRIGYKTFSITLVEDKIIKQALILRVKEIIGE